MHCTISTQNDPSPAETALVGGGLGRALVRTFAPSRSSHLVGAA